MHVRRRGERRPVVAELTRRSPFPSTTAHVPSSWGQWRRRRPLRRRRVRRVLPPSAVALLPLHSRRRAGGVATLPTRLPVLLLPPCTNPTPARPSHLLLQPRRQRKRLRAIVLLIKPPATKTTVMMPRWRQGRPTTTTRRVRRPPPSSWWVRMRRQRSPPLPAHGRLGLLVPEEAQPELLLRVQLQVRACVCEQKGEEGVGEPGQSVAVETTERAPPSPRRDTQTHAQNTHLPRLLGETIIEVVRHACGAAVPPLLLLVV